MDGILEKRHNKLYGVFLQYTSFLLSVLSENFNYKT